MTLDSNASAAAVAAEISTVIPADRASNPPAPAMAAPMVPDAFATLGLDPQVLRAAVDAGYTVPTPVQLATIPAAIGHRDVLVSSQTGSGKTAAFLFPALHRLTIANKTTSPLKRGAPPRVLVLVPTRELALQVQKAAFDFSRSVRGVRTAALVGGTPYGQQLRALRDGADIVVATPGRLKDHLDRRTLALTHIEMLVLDEADRMLDMGFIDDIQAIVARTPNTRQTLLFSATLDGVVGDLAKSLTKNAQRIQIAGPKAHEVVIAQSQLHADSYAHKGRLLDALLRDTALEQAIIFTSTKQSADDLTNNLLGEGFPVAALHGDMHQRERTRTIHLLREQRIRILVATDVAARGIDILSITHIINFDLPRQAEDYVHRIGRTGRAGRSGTAISFVAPGEHRQMQMIERFTGQPVRVATIAGLEPTVVPQRAGAGRKPGTWRGKPGGGTGTSYKGKPSGARRFGAKSDESGERGRPPRRSFTSARP